MGSLDSVPWRVASVAIVAILVVVPVAACTAEYRSTERQVLDSPLVFVGSIESAEPRKEAEDRWDRSDGVPQVAVVRVRRVLKGNWTEETIRVKNGPVHS